MERAILVRHGESVFSARGLATGSVDVRCPLSDRGVAQARALAAEPPGGGERRQAIIARYAAGFATIRERSERVILVVTHSLPIAYLLMALSGRDPAPQVPLVEYAKAHAVTAEELARAIARLEAW